MGAVELTCMCAWGIDRRRCVVLVRHWALATVAVYRQFIVFSSSAAGVVSVIWSSLWPAISLSSTWLSCLTSGACHSRCPLGARAIVIVVIHLALSSVVAPSLLCRPSSWSVGVHRCSGRVWFVDISEPSLGRGQRLGEENGKGESGLTIPVHLYEAIGRLAQCPKRCSL